MEDGSSSLSQWIKLTLTVTSSSMIFLVVHVIRVDDRRALLVRPLAPCARGSWAGGLVGSSRVVCAGWCHVSWVSVQALAGSCVLARPRPACCKLVHVIEKSSPIGASLALSSWTFLTACN